MRVQALFAEEPVDDVFDENTNQTEVIKASVMESRNSSRISYLVRMELEGKEPHQTHIDSINSQNDRIDDKVEQLTRYLESREEQLSQSFMKMEEMQSKMDTRCRHCKIHYRKNHLNENFLYYPFCFTLHLLCFYRMR